MIAGVAPLSAEVLTVLELLALAERVEQGIAALQIAVVEALSRALVVLVSGLWPSADFGGPSRADERTPLA